MILNCTFICKLFKIKNQIFTGRSQEWNIVNDAGINLNNIAIQVWTCYSIVTEHWLLNAKKRLKHAQWLWVCFFIYPHNYKGQCCMVIWCTEGGGGGRVLPEIWTSIIIELFLIDFHCHTKFTTKRESGGPPPENVYIFEARELHFMCFNWVLQL
jgi:hypothetical protein